ncbi:YraN family protein [Nocardioides dongxiaopingii]|jgi:putative endonuclease|uniref:YraN family protein n=1 Tax=Nocardioides TaxID=1839 RepID=UPI0010C764D0|nr:MULTISPECIES: YraN family protein [Nocardioides]QCW51317.1 YraN family protein [Nocardioides sp. S-1144]
MTTTRVTRATTSRQAIGAYGERVAERYLVEQGMVTLDANWRCREGEIDLVLREGPVLVVCEVKTRTSLVNGSPHEAITDVKRERLQRLGVRWAEARGVRPAQIRVDLVAVMRPRRGPAVVEHVRGVG